MGFTLDATTKGEANYQVAALTSSSYNERMGYEWDEEKRRVNREKHGVDFSTIEGFDWANSTVRQDNRHQEQRYIAVGRVGTRLHVVVFTRRGADIRIISFRRANSREVRNYEQRQIPG